MKKNNLFLKFLTVFFLGCLITNGQSSIIKDEKISSLIEKKRAYNKQHGSGYRIQLYYGDEKVAKSYLNEFKSNFPDVYSKLGYAKPYWNVQVGSYKSRLDADRALNKIREKFSGAIIINK